MSSNTRIFGPWTKIITQQIFMRQSCGYAAVKPSVNFSSALFRGRWQSLP